MNIPEPKVIDSSRFIENYLRAIKNYIIIYNDTGDKEKAFAGPLDYGSITWGKARSIPNKPSSIYLSNRYFREGLQQFFTSFNISKRSYAFNSKYGIGRNIDDVINGTIGYVSTIIKESIDDFQNYSDEQLNRIKFEYYSQIYTFDNILYLAEQLGSDGIKFAGLEGYIPEKITSFLDKINIIFPENSQVRMRSAFSKGYKSNYMRKRASQVLNAVPNSRLPGPRIKKTFGRETPRYGGKRRTRRIKVRVK